MEKNMKYILIAAALAIVIIVAALALTSTTEDVFYDSQGTVKAKSSDLTFKYKNEESIYGAFNQDYTLNHTYYYDEAKISGNVKIDLNKVKWDESYVPDNSTDEDGNVIVHVNNVTYAKENFTKVLMEDYNNDSVNISVDVYLEDKNGDVIRSESSYGEGVPMIISNYNLEDGVMTLKFKHDYHMNITNEMFNGPDYNGNLLDSRNDDHKISKARIVLNFFNDDYSFEVEDLLKGDDFTHVHM